METREHIKIIMGSRSPSGLPSIVEVPPVPPPNFELPKAQSQIADPHLQSRAELEAARKELQALDHLLEVEETKLAELQGSLSVSPHISQNADFISLARQEVESEYERLSNYFKRRQNMSQRMNTLDSGIADMNAVTSPSDRFERPPRLGLPMEGSWSRFQNYDPGFDIDQTLKPTAVARGSPPSPSKAPELPAKPTRAPRKAPRRSSSIDSLSKTKERYLERFEQELAEIDGVEQFPPISLPVLPPPAIPISPDPVAMELDANATKRLEIDDDIFKTRKELSDLLERTFPTSPIITLSSKFSPATTAQSPVASSSPIFGQESPLLQKRPSIPQSVRSNSIDLSSWNWLAKEVSVTSFHYSCGQCKTPCSSAMQFARRPTGGLSFRIICTTSWHAQNDAVLFRQDLSSSSAPLPHIFHSRADPSAAKAVQVKGSSKRLEFYSSGNKTSIPLSAQPKYHFASFEDAEIFQQLVFGMLLVRKFDIRAISSSADDGPPSRFETLRIWQASGLQKLVLMTHGVPFRGSERAIFYEEKAAFDKPNAAGERKLRLKMLDQGKPGAISRRYSRDSGISGLSFSSAESQASQGTSATGAGAQRIKWLEIEFENKEERSEFLEIWTAQRVAM